MLRMLRVLRKVVFMKRPAPRRPAPSKPAPLVAWKDQAKLDAGRAAWEARCREAAAKARAERGPDTSATQLLESLAKLGCPPAELRWCARLLADLGFLEAVGAPPAAVQRMRAPVANLEQALLAARKVPQ